MKLAFYEDYYDSKIMFMILKKLMHIWVCVLVYIYDFEKYQHYQRCIWKTCSCKKENKNFSELFLRLLGNQRIALENSFGAWNLTEEEMTEIWGDIVNRPGRKWTKHPLGSD